MADAAYMATQFGHECWCTGVGWADYRRHGVGVCDKYCEGNGVRKKEPFVFFPPVVRWMLVIVYES